MSTSLAFSNPVFAAYALSAGLMILMVAATAWLTVVRMVTENGGFRAPEDLKKTPINPNPDPSQLAPNEKVERVRRIMANHLENIPFFLAAGFLFVLTGPPLLLAQAMFYGYALSRAAHFAAYFTAQIHEVRATFWTIGSLIIVYMAGAVAWAAISA